MKNPIQNLVKIIILVSVVAGAMLVLKSLDNKKKSKTVIEEGMTPKAALVRDLLKKYAKPQRVEIFNRTDRFFDDVEEIQKVKFETDPSSKFYITIQFFTDETDSAAPLVAQIRFIESEGGNTVKEESINLE